MIAKIWVSRNEALDILNLADKKQLNSELAAMVKEASERRLEKRFGHATFVKVVIDGVDYDNPHPFK